MKYTQSIATLTSADSYLHQFFNPFSLKKTGITDGLSSGNFHCKADQGNSSALFPSIDNWFYHPFSILS
jgi:hypothetical protein